MKYAYFIECVANKDQYSLSYGFYIVISTWHPIPFGSINI